MENKPTINKVKNRFLFLSPSVQKALEAESKITDFEVLDKLGEGSFGKVYKARHKTTNVIYAIKSIDKLNKNNQEGKPYFRREIEIMYKVNHPNIVKLYGHFEDDQNIYFVLEYIPKGNLYTILSRQKTKSFEATTVANLIKDLICSIYYLHKMDPPIIHRDIKPENVLLSESNKIKLTDFGWSNYVEDTSIRSTYCGTPVYLAPEMIKEIGHDESLDIWCIGILMFELLTGGIPFKGNDQNVLNENILKNKIIWPKDMDISAKNLISKILKTDPNDRISLTDMLKHPFFVNNCKNPTENLFNPSDDKDEVFILSKDTPNLNSNVNTITNTKVNNNHVKKNSNTENASQINNQISTNNNSNESKISNNPSNISNEDYNKNSNNSNNNNTNKSNAYVNTNSNNNSNSNSNNNANLSEKEKLIKLISVHENLLKEYKILSETSASLSKKNEDLEMKQNYFLKEKTQLIKERDEIEGKMLEYQAQLAEIKSQIYEYNSKIKALNREINTKDQKILNDTKEIESLNNKLEEIFLEKEEDEKFYKEKISNLEGKLNEGIIIRESQLDQEMTLIRESLMVNFSENEKGKFDSPFGRESLNHYEEKLKKANEDLAQKIEILKDDFTREKDKFNIILKSKDDEIRKLNSEKNSKRESEMKKFELISNKYENTVRSKDAEIENLKAKVKKLEGILSLNKIQFNK